MARTRLGLFGYGAASYAGFSAKQSAEIPTGNIDITGGVPVCSTWNQVNPPAGLVSITGVSPESQPVLQPSTGVISLTGSTPDTTGRVLGKENRVTRPGLFGYSTRKYPRILPKSASVTGLSLFGFGMGAYKKFTAKGFTAQELRPTTGLITTTGFSPSGTGDQAARQPTTGNINTVGYAPTVDPAATVYPSSGVISESGNTPTIQLGRYQVTQPGLFGYGAKRQTFVAKGFSAQESRPSVGAVSFSGYTVTVEIDGVQYPANGVITTRGGAPVVTVDGLNSLTPTTGLISTRGGAPAAEIGQRAPTSRPSLFGYAMGKYERFIAKASASDVQLEPATGIITTVGQVAIYPESVTPQTGLVKFKGHLYNNGWFSPGWFSAHWFSDNWFYRQTIISTDQQFGPSTGLITVQGYAPTVDFVEGTITLGPSSGLVKISGKVPVTSPGTTVSPSQNTLNTVGYSPAISIEQTAKPSTGSLSETGYSSDVYVQRPVSVSPIQGIVTTDGKIAPLSFETVYIAPKAATLTTVGQTPLVAHVFLYPSGQRIDISGYAPTVDTKYWVPVGVGSPDWSTADSQSASWAAVAQGSTDWAAADAVNSEWTAAARVVTSWSK